MGVGVRPQGFLDWEGVRKAAAGAPRLGGEWGAGRGMGWEEWGWQWEWEWECARRGCDE